MKSFYYTLSALLLFVFSAGALYAQDDIITVAGNTSEGYAGDSGLASRCLMHWPESIAINKIGDVYFADADNNVIRMINPSTGKITTVAGSGFESGTGTGGFGGDGGPASAAKLFYPSGVAFDTSGNLYIADSYNNRVRMVNTSGIISTFAGTGMLGYMGDGGTANSALLDTPTRVATDRFGNVYIADYGNNVIRQVDAGLNIFTFAGAGTPGFTGDGGLANMALLYRPRDMAVDTNGVVYIADYANSRIRKVDITGTITTIAGIMYPGYSGDGGQATAANIFEPSGIAADDSGNVYFSEFQNGRVRKITPAGIITTVAGNGISGYGGDGGLAVKAKIYFPEGLAIDRYHGIYIADKANNRIRYISATLGVSAAPMDRQGVKIYPNPGNGSFLISITSGIDEPVTVKVVDMAGRKVSEGVMTTNQQAEMKLPAPPGVYFLSAITAHGAINEKVVIQ